MSAAQALGYPVAAGRMLDELKGRAILDGAAAGGAVAVDWLMVLE